MLDKGRNVLSLSAKYLELFPHAFEYLQISSVYIDLNALVIQVVFTIEIWVSKIKSEYGIQIQKFIYTSV